MTYPMMGTDDNYFSRSQGDWTTLSNYFTLLTGSSEELRILQRSKKTSFTVTLGLVFNIVFDGNRKGFNPHYLPHGGAKWGNNFTVVEFRLDRKSRKRRFIPRKRAK